MANESGPNRPNRPMRPRQGGPGARRKRRVVIDNAANRPRDARQQQREREASRPKTPREVAPVTGPVVVQSGVTVRDLSQALGVPAHVVSVKARSNDGLGLEGRGEAASATVVVLLRPV